MFVASPWLASISTSCCHCHCRVSIYRQSSTCCCCCCLAPQALVQHLLPQKHELVVFCQLKPAQVGCTGGLGQRSMWLGHASYTGPVGSILPAFWVRCLPLSFLKRPCLQAALLERVCSHLHLLIQQERAAYYLEFPDQIMNCVPLSSYLFA
jgi:hypothetical protein